jgi:hypothetical protein
MDKPSPIHEYNLIADNDNETATSVWRLEPNHTHFHFFDNGNDIDDGKDEDDINVINDGEDEDDINDANDGDDETNNVQNVLLKRHEIEHELSISKVLRSPVVGYQPESTSMCCQD